MANNKNAAASKQEPVDKASLLLQGLERVRKTLDVITLDFTQKLTLVLDR